MKKNKSLISRILRFCGKIVTTIVSGLPRERITLKPENKATLVNKKESFKRDDEKHYHRPVAKPVVEKQTLLKEVKKTKAPHQGNS
ncbi:hypothetical protein [uncultured Draconibacterium sp.]|uniref:hypothetical protein n=1 Tax=uncultured Draconibacterium sp. TaxID=1573823 RepID=UPI0032175846